MTAAIFVRVTDAEAAAIDTVRVRDESRAAFVRRAALEAAGAAQETVARRTTAAPPADLAAASNLCSELNRIGGALVMVAKAARMGGAPGLHAQAELAISEVRRAAAGAAALVERWRDLR